jgi:enamine deaminase RidA (YjgF/YER057c/UK114 family)
MEIERHQPSEMFSQMVIHGDTVYLAGQVGEGETMTEQMTAVLQKIDQLLSSVGSDRSKLLSATIWLANIETFAEMNDVWLSWVDQANKPVRATVEARLANPAFLVEVMAVAAR